MAPYFSSTTRRNGVWKLLQSFCLSHVLQENICSITTKLEELRETITSFTPQGPSNHQSASDKADFPHDAVIIAE